MYRPITVLASLLFAAASPVLAGPSGLHVIDRIAGPDGGWDFLDIDTAHDRVLMARGPAAVAVDLKSRAVTTLATGGKFHAASAIKGGGEALLTDGPGNMAVFLDGATGATLAKVATGRNPDAIVEDLRNGRILVMNHSGGDITIYDGATHSAVATVAVGGKLEAGVADGKGRVFVNVEDRSEIVGIDVAAAKVVSRWKLTGCEGPTGLALDAADGLLIAACDGGTGFVSLATGKTVQSLPTGPEADGVVFDARRRLAYVPAADGMMRVISVGAGGRARQIDSVATGEGARTIALDSRTGRVYLPSAQFPPTPAGGVRPPMIPGSFRLLVVGK